MNSTLVKLYLVETLKMTLIFLVIRVALEWMTDSKTFDLTHSVTHQFEFALIFGAIMGIVRVIRLRGKV